ncbi:MAG: hypothetical protein IKP69_05160 [Oscillospiraceae bacterium]|nr:hypothetical protein [Oscillospiraceae bacterium]
MKTDIISICSDKKGRTEALEQAERFAEYHGLTDKKALHIRLLTEEAISMIHEIVSEFQCDFWLESEQSVNGLLCKICISADVDVNEWQENELLKVATSGKNEDAKGILGKLRQFLRWSLQQSDEETASQSDVWYTMGSVNHEKYWSLQQYRQNLMKKDSAKWDELEKSIIIRLADEVKIGIRTGKAEMIIEKKFPAITY